MRYVHRSLVRGLSFCLLLSGIAVVHGEVAPPATVVSEPPPSTPNRYGEHELPTSAEGEETVDLARALLPARFKQFRGSSHQIFSDSDPDALGDVRHLLRRCWSEYRGFSRRMGVVVPKPDERLVCIVFDQQDEFLAFARKTEGAHRIFEHASGYFSPRFDWIVLYEPRYDRSTEAFRRQLDEDQRKLDDARRQIEPGPLARRQHEELDRYQRQLDQQGERLESWARETRTAVVIHEAIHQFTHVCHTWPGEHQWPVWLHEGLATAFESADPDSGFGPDRLDPNRDRQFRTLFEADRLIPLEAFLKMKSYGDQRPETLEVLYPQAYGLLTWLYAHRSPQLAQYLRRLSAPPEVEGERDPVVLFNDVFGPVDNLERRWHRLEETDWRGHRP